METKIQKKKGMGICNIVIGLLLIAGPRSLFEVCPHTEKIMKCWWSVQAELGIGIIIIAAGILYLVFSGFEAKAAISSMVMIVSIVGILIPSILIGGCPNPMMSCQSTTFPWIYVICVISALANLGNILLLRRSGGRNNDQR